MGRLSSLRVLVVEDDVPSAVLLERGLLAVGFDVSLAQDGVEAWELLQRHRFDAVLTDWMMPRLDGMRLIRMIRSEVDPVPWIIVITALGSSPEARSHAIDAGANEFVAKPYLPDQIARRLVQRLDGESAEPEDRARLEARLTAAGLGSTVFDRSPSSPTDLPAHVGVCLAASTGGPSVLGRLLPGLDVDLPASYYLVQHGPAWMLENFAQRLQRDTNLCVSLARAGTVPQPGHLYLAPGNRHLKIQRGRGLSLELSNEPTENFVRPAADPLFRSAASVFGRFCLGVVLTGLGRDASAGASVIANQGGRILLQNPDTAEAGSMPRAVLEAGVQGEVHEVEDLARALRTRILEMASQLSGAPRPGRPPTA